MKAPRTSTRSGRRGWRRWLLLGAASLVAVVLVAAVVLAIALRIPRVQQLVIGGVSEATEEQFGFSVAAESLQVGLLRGKLEVGRLALRAGAGEPFARVEKAVVRFRPASLFRDPVDLSLLELKRLEVDLDAPLPALVGEEAETEPLGSIPLVVDRLRIIDGQVAGTLPSAARELLETFRLTNLALEARFDGRRLEVAELTTRADLGRRDQPALDLRLETSAEVELSGAANVERFEVSGEDLSLEASLIFAKAIDESSGRFRIEADPGRLLRGEPTGSVEAEGSFDLNAWSGRVQVEAPEQSAAWLSWLRFVTPELAESLELGSTGLDLRLDLELGLDDGARREIDGTVEVVAARGEMTLLRLDALPRLWLSDGPLTSSTQLAALVPAQARLLPGRSGARTAEVTLSAEEARRAETWLIESAVVTMEEPSAEELLAALSESWPRLVPASSRDLPSDFSVLARADFGGPLADPWSRARAQIEPAGQGLVKLTATGRPLSKEWTVEAEGAALELAQFAPTASGEFDFHGRLEDALGASSGSFELLATELATESGTLFESLELSLCGGRRKVDWSVAGALASAGAVRGQGDLVPARILKSAAGQLQWDTGSLNLPRVDAIFELSGGALEASFRAPLRPESALEARLVMPLGALDALPQLGDLSALPVERSAGPVLLNWNVPLSEWSGFLPAEWRERVAPVNSLTGGSAGSLAIDLGCFACSSGSAEMTGFAIDLGGRQARALDELHLELADGSLAIETWKAAGEGFELDLSGEARLSRGWRAGGAVRDLVSEGRLAVSAALDASWLDPLPVTVTAPGTLGLRADLSSARGDVAGTASLIAPELRFALDAYPSAVLGDLSLDLRLGRDQLEWNGLRLAVNEAQLTSEGRARLSAPLSEARGVVRLQSGLPVLTAADLPFRIEEGRLSIGDGRLATAGGEGTVEIDWPLDRESGGSVRARWDLPVNDWAPLVARWGGGQETEVLELATRGSLTLPLDRPALAEGRLDLTHGRLVVRGRETLIEPGVEVTARDGSLQVPPFELRSSSESFVFQAAADLDTDWAFTEPVGELVRDFEIDGNGDLDAGLLNPLLAGGRAEGSLNLRLEVAGSPSTFEGRVEVEGPRASIFYRSPYLARFERPSLEVAIRDGRLTLERGDLVLNEGALSLSGRLSGEAGTDVGIKLSDALFRLDYGLLATLSTDLRYRSGDDGRSAISGSVDMERGTLTRNVQLDLDLLSQLIAPIDLATTEDDPLDLIDLDLAVTTREGVRVKNNLGDLLVRWEPLEVTGTLARPVVEGRLEVDPGGLLHAYGQTVRLDSAVIEYPGLEGADPRLDLEVTTSLEDPTLGQLAAKDPFRTSSPRREEEAGSARAEVTENLARFYGEQFAGRLGESVGLSLSLRPLLIFGEADPGARLTISRDLSPNLALAASIDLQGAEDRTYLLEAHELRALPRLVAQAFTDDGSAFGGALLQRQEWGGSGGKATSGLPRISKIVSDPPDGVSRRGIRRALGLEKGDLFDSQQRFVAEVELVDYLMRKGYPDARATVRVEPDGRGDRRVRLVVGIEPGPHVEFAFEGEKIPKSLRALIQSLYRPDFFESESIEEMRAETVRALRSQGYLEPEVEIVVEPVSDGTPVPDRRVFVRTEGGVRISPDPPVFVGLEPEDSELARAAFANAVQRVELAVGLPSADRRLLSTLATIGFPEAQVLNRYQSLGDRVLTVEIDPGPREHIRSLEIEVLGAPEPEGLEAGEIRALLSISEGEPLRRNRLSRSALAIERAFGERGYLDARVQASLEPFEGDPYSKRVRWLVNPGSRSRLGAVEFKGLRSTKQSFARNVTGLEEGEPLAQDALSGARTSLWKTGLFSGVAAEVVEGESGLDRVVFDLEERDRYRLTYGVRWDSEDGMGAVVDATDDNFLGRGWTLGLRALTSSDEDSLRGLVRVPRAFGGPGSLELFAADRNFVETTFLATDGDPLRIDSFVDRLEGTLQYSHPLGEKSSLRIYGRYSDQTTTSDFLPFPIRVKNPQLGLQYVYDGRSAEPIVERGIFASFDLSGSREFLGGDLAYVRSFSQLSLYRPIGRLLGARLLWSQAYRVGLAEAFDQRLSGDVVFLAGGEYSVRGYETESLGRVQPVDRTGQSALLVINQELRWRLFRDYTLVLFADAGNVWLSLGDFGDDLFTSAGLGMRAVTPVGLLRLDLATPFEGRPGIDPDYKLYFGLGTTF